MRSRSVRLSLAGLAVLVLLGCQTPLPVDRPGAPEPAGIVAVPEPPSPRPVPSSRWLQALERNERSPGWENPFQLEITPDRLQEVARYDPTVSTPGRARSFILVVDTCTAHQTGHRGLR